MQYIIKQSFLNKKYLFYLLFLIFFLLDLDGIQFFIFIAAIILDAYSANLTYF